MSRAFLPLSSSIVRRARRLWRQYGVFWLGAIAVGLVAVLYARLIDWGYGEFRTMQQHHVWAPLIVTPAVAALAVWLTRKFFRGAEGSGIPQSIFALQPDSGEKGLLLLRPHIVVGRMILACVGLFCGGSIGREGPTVHVGAAISLAFGRWMPHGGTSAQRRALILAGGAAGVAAAFNTPLAGIVFAIEELSKSFEERASGATLTAVVLSGVVAIAIVGDYTYFGQPVVGTAAQSVSLGTFLVAIAGGLAGGLFSRLTLIGVSGLPGFVRRFHKARPALFAGVCGLIVAAVGVASGGLTYGTGYAEARSILEGHASLPWFYAPARAVATLATSLSGIPAGLLAPSLSVGAGLGQVVGDLSGQVTAVPFAILGMCGYLAGVTQAPLTSFVIVMEMTTQHAMVLPLMITAAVATTISKLLSPPLYQTLADRYAG